MNVNGQNFSVMFFVKLIVASVFLLFILANDVIVVEGSSDVTGRCSGQSKSCAVVVCM